MNLRRWDLLAVVAVGLGHPLKKDQFPDCNLLDRQSNQNIPIMSEYFFFQTACILSQAEYDLVYIHYMLLSVEDAQAM